MAEMVETKYGPFSLDEVLAWPVQVCPTCGREHAHPPRVSADYWPQCWDCFYCALTSERTLQDWALDVIALSKCSACADSRHADCLRAVDHGDGTRTVCTCAAGPCSAR